jgi:collagenase-like PrtC family protease
MEMRPAESQSLRISLGPLLYYWPRDQVFSFYEEVAAWPVDAVYLGETVCSKRFELRPDDWLAIAARLADAGKEVVLSTCELIESESDLRLLRRITANGRFRVEANDLGAVHLLAGKTPFVAGPFLNIYSRMSLDLYRELGASRWVMPLELGRAGLGEIFREPAPGLETEVFAHGRLPLAVSARCFTARYNNQSKDDCGFRCIEHPDGLTVSTQDDQSFLVLNGLQTQSARIHNLYPQIAEMAGLGVSHVRISPQSAGTGEVVRAFHAAANGTAGHHDTAATGLPWRVEDLCNGYWHGRPGLEQVREVTHAVSA